MAYYLPLLKNGLKLYLDDERVMRRHKGHGFDDWEAKYADRRVSIRELMTYMGVKHYGTMATWVTQYEREKMQNDN